MAGKLPSLKSKAVVYYHSSDDNESDEEEEECTGNDLSLGLSLEKLNLGPRKKLLVLCLGGLLVHRVYRFDCKTNDGRYRRPDVIAGSFLVFNRPFSNEFLKFCFERFEVGIWSSAKEWNVDGVLDSITRGLKDKPLFVWDQKECTRSGFQSLEKKDKPIFFKELKKIWDDRRQYCASNTLLIDDDPYKALLNPPNTAVFPESYKVDKENDTVLGSKGELRLFLAGLSEAPDVPSYVKDHPIGQPAITESDRNWDYYSKIIRHFR